MISSTAVDLPEHRRHARCLRAHEHVAARDGADARVTRGRARHVAPAVDEADFYLGIFAFRYGTVPEGHDKSISEQEYDRAIERGIRVFIFIAHDEHLVPLVNVEKGAGAEKLEVFKQCLKTKHVVRFFRSAEELRTEIISALSAYRQDDSAKLHYVAEITAYAVGRPLVLAARQPATDGSPRRAEPAD